MHPTYTEIYEKGRINTSSSFTNVMEIKLD